MDPISHLLLGGAAGVLGGAKVSVHSGNFWAITLGSVIPDIDIILQYWGDYIYLKHHRGFSHSLGGLVLFSLIIAGILSIFFSYYQFLTLFFWALVGCISHSFLDILNSYGAMIFYPFSRKKYTFNLLMITDPVLIICTSITLYFKTWIFMAIFIVYLFLRLYMRKKAEREIRKYYKGYLTKLVVMPAFIGFVKWDFIAVLKNVNVIGQISVVNNKIKIHKKLKLISEEIKETFENTSIGIFFKEFTPFFHVNYKEENNLIIAVFTDMRYFVRNRFLHHATVILDKEKKSVRKELFQPYTPKNKIEIN